MQATVDSKTPSYSRNFESEKICILLELLDIPYFKLMLIYKVELIRSYEINKVFVKFNLENIT